MTAAVSIGLRGDIGGHIISELAPRIEAAGFHGLWLNDTAGGHSLEGLAVAASVTTRLALATGVIALDRLPADGILAKLDGLPLTRLTIGIGAGGPADALARVGAGVDTLRAGTTASIVVGALGPRMRRLAAARADGALLSWLTPSTAAQAAVELRRDSGGRPVRAILYARSIADQDAAAALTAECDLYAGIPSYAANFERLGIRPQDATVATPTELAAYRDAVDEVVLRVITASGSLQQLEQFVDHYGAALTS